VSTRAPDPGHAGAVLAEGRRRYEAGDYAQAEPLAQGALDAARSACDERLETAALQLLGECAYSLGRYPDAAALVAQVLARRPERGVDRAEARTLEGVVAISRGDPASGLVALDEALEDREGALGPDHADTLETLNDRGVALDRLDRRDEALAVHEEALRRCERSSDGPTRQLAVTCNALAVKLDRADETRPRAQALYTRALEAGEAALGPEHPLVVTMLANLGVARLNGGDVEGGRELTERALVLHERRYGPDHPNTAFVLRTAAHLDSTGGQPGRGVERATRALAIRRTALGHRDPRTVDALGGVIRALDAAIRAGVVGAEMADAVALLTAYRELGGTKAPADSVGFRPDPEAAERAVESFLERSRARLEPDPGRTRALERATAAGLAADAAFLRRDMDTASLAAGERVALIESVDGAASPLLFEPLRRWAVIERARGDERTALGLDRRALGVLGAVYGPRHPFVLKARAQLTVEASRVDGPRAARAELAALLAILETAEEGGIAAFLRDRVRVQLAAMDRRIDEADRLA
jgi:tetratricopeptide (TPR) repeat protein